MPTSPNPKAFPSLAPPSRGYGGAQHDGMTLRDYFAGQALGGLGSMLAEREKVATK